MSEGYPSQVSLYDVCVGMALVSEQARELLKGKDQLFAEIHAFGEGRAGAQWTELIRTLLGDSEHPAVHDQQGDWCVGKRRFLRLFQALIYRLTSIGGYGSLRLAQQRRASTQRALSAAIAHLSMTERLELPTLLASIPVSISKPPTASSSGPPMPGDGKPGRGS